VFYQSGRHKNVSWIRAIRQCRRGAAAVEFAFVAPIFLLIVLGTVEVSRALWVKASMQFAVEETARYALVNTGSSMVTLETYAATELASSGFNDANVVFDAVTDTKDGVNFVTISATYDFNLVSGLVPFDDLELLATTRVPLEEN